MNDKKLFSQFYSTDISRHEDKQKFRDRVLKYSEDFVNAGWPDDTYRLCRHVMGLDINIGFHGNLLIEETFNTENTPISQILDFISIVYDSLLPHLHSTVSSRSMLKDYIEKVNRIFQEESMCYVLHDNGRVRYYPDEEFHQAVRSTLTILNKPKFMDNLKTFNNVLDDLYKNYDKESPINEFFKCVETFSLSIIGDKSFNRLNESSIAKLMSMAITNINLDPRYVDHDKEATSNIQGIFKKWVDMCHKYRHGKADQINASVPTELFNQIFSTGISIFRYLLELDDKYNFTK